MINLVVFAIVPSRVVANIKKYKNFLEEELVDNAENSTFKDLVLGFHSILSSMFRNSLFKNLSKLFRPPCRTP